MQTIHYTVTPLVSRNVFLVNMSIDHAPEHVEVYLPTWTAGSYMLRDFARHIINIKAHDSAQQPLQITPTGQSSWRIESRQKIRIQYEVYAHDTSVRTAFLDDTTGFFNGTSVFLSVKNLENTKHKVTLKQPASHKNWQVATTLQPMKATKNRAFGDYIAHNYDELVDHPVRMGKLTWLSFNVCNTPHYVAIAGRIPQLNAKLLEQDFKRICESHIDFFNDSAPFKEYLFIVDARSQPDAFGGLEHRNSTALLCHRDALPIEADNTQRRPNYITFLGLCSHEYFHSWNVKRIKPANFVTYDLTQTIDTSLLWFFEGVTSYYDDLMLLRSEIIDLATYLKLLEKTINSVAQYDGRLNQTVSESGFYAWTKYYQTSANTPNAVVSYYTKGALVALTLDLYIRQNSAFSFDDVMRDLWRKFGQDFYNNPRGLKLADIIQTCTQYVPEIGSLIQLAIHSTQELPLATLLKQQGFELNPIKPTPQLGASVKKTDDGYLITRVFNQSSAQQAGLAPDDVLIAFDSMKLSENPDQVLAQFKNKQKIKVHYWRDGVLRHSILVNRTNEMGGFELKANVS